MSSLRLRAFSEILIHPAALFRRCCGPKHCWSVLSLCPLGLSMASFQCPGAHPASLCPCCVLWGYCATLCEQNSLSQPAPEERAAAGRAPSIWSSHIWWLRQSHEPEPAVSDHSWITDTIPVHTMLGWVHTWQHLYFMFGVQFTIKIGKTWQI